MIAESAICHVLPIRQICNILLQMNLLLKWNKPKNSVLSPQADMRPTITHPPAAVKEGQDPCQDVRRLVRKDDLVNLHWQVWHQGTHHQSVNLPLSVLPVSLAPNHCSPSHNGLVSQVSGSSVTTEVRQYVPLSSQGFYSHSEADMKTLKRKNGHTLRHFDNTSSLLISPCITLLTVQ